MRKDWSDELQQVTFRCQVCRHTWSARPDLVEPDEDAPHHPYRYFGNCPVCDAKHQPQAPWERALLKAHQASTGPRTPAGKAATAANLAGHPTPEEALRTRFNGMKHGLNARTATYFPSKPDGYSFCKRCDVDRDWCDAQPACVKQTELFMLHHAAFEQRDPKVLARVHSDLHAALVASLQLCIQTVLGDGVVIKTPKLEWVLDKDGEGRHERISYVDANGELRYVYDYAANPAFKPIADLVTRLGLSLADLGMTVKAAEDEDAELKGRLNPGVQAAEAMQAFGERMAAALEKLPGTMSAARAKAEKDPVLLEHQAQTGGGGAS
jgi:hypothetical protein